MRKLAPVFAIVLLTGCGKLLKAKDTVSDPPTADEIKTAVVDKLHCSGIMREETRELVGRAVKDKDFKQLATKPVDLARMVVGVTATTNSTALITGNIEEVARRGHFKEVITQGWDDLQCGQTRSYTCTDALSGNEQGKGETSVMCDGSTPQQIRTKFRDKCRLFGTENKGAMTVARDGDLSFDSFALGSARKVDGDFGIETESGELRRINVDTGQKLTVTSDVGKSCQQELILRQLEATDSDGRSTLAFDAARSSSDKKVRVRTLDKPTTWKKPVRCSCPTDGAVEIQHSDPVGLGEPGTLRVSFGAGKRSCSRANVDIVNWPTGCKGRKDCGSGIIEGLVGELVTASCAGF